MPAIDFIHWDLYTADAPALADDPSWTPQPHLIAMSFVEGLAPTLSQLSFRWEFGSMSRAHRATPDASLDYRGPLALQSKYVLLRRADLSRWWVGYVRDEGRVEWSYEDDGAGGLRASGGTQTFTAVGLEYFLGRQQISGRSSREADRATRPLAYNSGAGEGRDLDEARRANREPPADPEADPFDPLSFSLARTAVLWDAAAIVKHLLAEQCPRAIDDEPAPCPFVLDDDAIEMLDWHRPTVRVEGRSLLEVLDEVIGRRRGLAWRVEPAVGGVWPDEYLVAAVKVTSAAPAPLPLPGGATLPAAASIVSLDDPTADYPLLRPPAIERDGSRRYHRVRVRGARTTTTFSADGPLVDAGVGGYVYATPISGVISPLWTAVVQADYERGVSLSDPDYATLDDDEKKKRNDRLRQAARFEHVFRCFSISDIVNVAPIINQATGSITGYFTAPARSVRVLRHTPLRAGYDYADAAAPTRSGDPPDGEEYQRPTAYTYLPKSAAFVPLTLGDDDQGWRRLHDLSSHPERGYDAGGEPEDAEERRFKASFSLAPLAGQPGIELRGGGMNHALLSLTDLETAELEPSAYPVVCAWSGTLVTVTTEWDSYCEAIWPLGSISAEPIEELLISIGDRARFDWLAAGAVYDLTDQGDLKQCTTAGAIRDDRALCETIARLAYGWYGVERAQVQLALAGGEPPLAVGDLLATIGSGAVAQTVNALVSQISYDLETGGIQINCGYPELDFGALA